MTHFEALMTLSDANCPNVATGVMQYEHKQDSKFITNLRRKGKSMGPNVLVSFISWPKKWASLTEGDWLPG